MLHNLSWGAAPLQATTGLCRVSHGCLGSTDTKTTTVHPGFASNAAWNNKMYPVQKTSTCCSDAQRSKSCVGFDLEAVKKTEQPSAILLEPTSTASVASVAKSGGLPQLQSRELTRISKRDLCELDTMLSYSAGRVMYIMSDILMARSTTNFAIARPSATRFI